MIEFLRKHVNEVPYAPASVGQFQLSFQILISIPIYIQSILMNEIE